MASVTITGVTKSFGDRQIGHLKPEILKLIEQINNLNATQSSTM